MNKLKTLVSKAGLAAVATGIVAASIVHADVNSTYLVLPDGPVTATGDDSYGVASSQYPCPLINFSGYYWACYNGGGGYTIALCEGTSTYCGNETDLRYNCTWGTYLGACCYAPR